LRASSSPSLESLADELLNVAVGTDATDDRALVVIRTSASARGPHAA
jgi:cytochrome c-type biogenesis protein CcmH/NrfG